MLFKTTGMGNWVGIKAESRIFSIVEPMGGPSLLWKAAMLWTCWFSICTGSHVKGASVLTAAGVWVKYLVLLAAALQSFSALNATAVFWVLDEISGTWRFTDTLTTIFIKLHVWTAESQLLEMSVIFHSGEWILLL